MCPFQIIIHSLYFLLADAVVHYPQETHLANVKQLTFGGLNAEAYFSFDDKKITYQATAHGSKCDQIFQFDLADGDMKDVLPRLVSTGLGRTTCSYFYPDNSHALYASTHLGSPECPPDTCSNETMSKNQYIAELCANHTYLWAIYSGFDIFKINNVGIIVEQLTNSSGYDAEATIAPNGKTMVFTSTRSGDLELWTMDLDGTNLFQVTKELGYDGGAFYSPDSKKLVFRASRPTGQDADNYRKLLDHNLVSPLNMELFTINADGTNQTQVTRLGNANWAPFYHPSGDKIIFSSNWNSSGGFNFNLWMIDETGNNLERITYDAVFDAFPMYSFDGKKLVFASARNSDDGGINLFIADWVELPRNRGNSLIFSVNVVLIMAIQLMLK